MLCTLSPEPILAVPDILKPVPPLISPLTPKPPTTLNAPEVEEVELVFESIDTAPIKVEVDWTLKPEPINTELVTLKPVPMLTLPDTPRPPVTVNAPEVDEVESVLLRIDTEPMRVDVPWTLNPAPTLVLPEMLRPVPPIMSPLTPRPPTTLNAPEVEDVAFVFESIDTAPIKVDVP